MKLSDIPIEVLADNLFPFLTATDLSRLARTCKFFAILCSDEAVWKRKLSSDFNFSGEETARRAGWKTIYRGLYNPKVYVWGDTRDGRLGSPTLPKSPNRIEMPYPIQLKISGARIVSIAAGGTSFHSLDSGGNVYVWGTLGNAGWASPSDGYSECTKVAPNPLKLILPAAVRSISCGRYHSSILDRNNEIWTFVNWGRPFSFTSPALHDTLSLPLQVECGWSHSALLTTSGDVFVWWPLTGALNQVVTQKSGEFDVAGDKKAKATSDGIPCVPWTTDFEPTRLPPIPSLSHLPATGIESDEPLRLVKIAGLEDTVIGLTNYGHVLRFGSLRDETSVAHGEWQYLPIFSDLNAMKDCQEFQDGKIQLPETLHITHISANFQHFVAYSTGSSSVVLIGNNETEPGSAPRVIPELQNRSVISVVIGDYHNAALTAEGKLFTWGQYSSGALGLGDPRRIEPGQPGGYAKGSRTVVPAVEVPTEVRFDHGRKEKKDRFCFAVTASGWHTGALVIDLEPDDEEDVYEKEDDASLEYPDDGDPEGRHQSPPIHPYQQGIFRIGHAGRGMRGMRGRGLGGGFWRGRDGPDTLL